jgi:hypothetical protein
MNRALVLSRARHWKRQGGRKLDGKREKEGGNGKGTAKGREGRR